MTGFGVSSVRKKDLELSVSVKTVNGRFRDIKIHIPRDYASFEADLKALVSEEIARGTVDVYVSRKSGAASSKLQVSVDAKMAEQWVKSYQSLARHLKLPSDVTLKTIGGLPGVFQVSESNDITDLEKKEVLRLTKLAVAACVKERKREGVSLKKDLLGLLGELKEKTDEMQSWQTQVRAILLERMKKRLEGVEKDLGLDPQRVAQEAALLADKADIAEELSRLDEHIKQCRALVSGSESVGKKLDFYCQELLREVNTVGSKSQVSQLTQIVVDAKAIVERFREQVQNVE